MMLSQKDQAIELLKIIESGKASPAQKSSLNRLTAERFDRYREPEHDPFLNSLRLSENFVNSIDNCLTLPIPEGARWRLSTPVYTNGEYKVSGVTEEYMEGDYVAALFLPPSDDPAIREEYPNGMVIPASALTMPLAILFLWWTQQDND